MIKRCLFFIILLLLTTIIKAQEPYAVLSESNTVLTFYYDNKKTSRNGQSVDINRGWENYANSILTAIFDRSFADCTSITSTSSWFSGCNNLTSIQGLQFLNTTNVSSMSQMFFGCKSLTILELDHFNTSKVKTMSWMFQGCTQLVYLDISNFDTRNVESMFGMFWGCYKLKSLNLSSFKTDKLESAQNMFGLCESLTKIYVSEDWNDASLTNSEGMFSNCSSLVGEYGTTYRFYYLNWYKTGRKDDFTLAKIDRPGCPGLFTNIKEKGKVKNIFTVDGVTYKTINLASNEVQIGSGENYQSAFISSTSLEGTYEIPTSVMDPNGYTFSVTSIGDYAFYECSNLISVDIPAQITTIGHFAFGGCEKLSSISFPNSLTSIGRYAFDNCKDIKSIKIPKSVSLIAEYGYLCSHCSSLVELIVESGNPYYDSRNNCNAIIETSTNTLIQGCNTTVIPNSISKIGNGAFSGSENLKSVTIPENVTEISSHAFADCTGLSSIIIPKSVNKIGDSVFSGCGGLMSLKVDEGNTIYDSRNDCNAIIETATNRLIQGSNCTIIPNTVTSLASYCFYKRKGLLNIIIPNSVKSIPDYAFYGCSSLESVEIPNSVTSIGNLSFAWCSSLKRVISHIEEPFSFPQTVFCPWNKEANAYEENKATLYVPLGTKSQYTNLEGWNTFKKIVEKVPDPYEVKDDQTVAVKVLEPDETGKVEIPEKVEIDGVEYTVTEIAEDAFKGNTELTEVTIPGTVTTIGSGAFEGCTNLKAIYVLSPTPASLAAAVSSRAQHKVASTTVSQFEGIDFETCVLYVPFGSEQAYREAEGWKEFKHIVGVHGETDLALTVTANSYSREYGEENPVFEFTTEGATLDGEPVIECEATPASPVGTYNIIVKKGGVKNYNDTYVKGTLTITKAPLTVKVEDAEREQGKENPQFVLTYTGWKNGETESVLTKKPVATTTATKESPAGVYDIVVSGGEAQNYELSYVSGTLTVTVPSSINFTPPLSQGEGAWYDLQGRKIKGQSVKKGVYVVNGRKVVIK